MFPEICQIPNLSAFLPMSFWGNPCVPSTLLAKLKMLRYFLCCCSDQENQLGVDMATFILKSVDPQGAASISTVPRGRWHAPSLCPSSGRSHQMAGTCGCISDITLRDSRVMWQSRTLCCFLRISHTCLMTASGRRLGNRKIYSADERGEAVSFQNHTTSKRCGPEETGFFLPLQLLVHTVIKELHALFFFSLPVPIPSFSEEPCVCLLRPGFWRVPHSLVPWPVGTILGGAPSFHLLPHPWAWLVSLSRAPLGWHSQIWPLCHGHSTPIQDNHLNDQAHRTLPRLG